MEEEKSPEEKKQQEEEEEEEVGSPKEETLEDEQKENIDDENEEEKEENKDEMIMSSDNGQDVQSEPNIPPPPNDPPPPPPPTEEEKATTQQETADTQKLTPTDEINKNPEKIQQETQIDPLIENLHRDFPDATAAECKRFINSCKRETKDETKVKEEAERFLEGYLEWRDRYGLDFKEGSIDDANNDASKWKFAEKKALDAAQTLADIAAAEKEAQTANINNNTDKEENGDALEIKQHDSAEEIPKDDNSGVTPGGSNIESSPSDGDDGDKKQEETIQDQPKSIPQLIFRHKNSSGEFVVDKEGKMLFHCIPAQLNRKDVTAETHGLAFAFYFDQYFGRLTEETATVVIDVRPGRGWPNPLAITLINFVRKVSRVLQSYYPERLNRLIVYPVPRAAIFIFNKIKHFFTAGTMSKVVLIPGRAAMGSPTPTEALSEYIDKEVLDIMENKRQQLFISTDESNEAQAETNDV